METEEIIKLLNNHEERIKKLEGTPVKDKLKTTNGHSGLAGGIRLIIGQGFLNTPRSLNELSSELKSKGYHYSVKSLSKALLIDFMKGKQILTRLKEDGFWKYVVRK